MHRPSRYLATRELCFVPPDGQFELLRFQLPPPLLASRVPVVAVDASVLSSTASCVVYRLSAAVHNAGEFVARLVEIRIPLPDVVVADTGTIKQPMMQSLVSEPKIEGQQLVWKLWTVQQGKPRTVQATCARRVATQHSNEPLPDITAVYGADKGLFSPFSASPLTAIRLAKLTNNGTAAGFLLWGRYKVRVRCTQSHTLTP